MDRWRHDCGSRKVRIISRPGSPMSEGRFDLSTFRSERTNEASTLTITPKRSSSRDVGTSSYRYHTATSSSPVRLKTRRSFTLNLSRAETSSRWCGVVLRRGCGVSSGVVHVT
ncbi:hypothetical protein TNCV_3111841 [Trichonephila clavipes]|nr:hypothetical protein TNCV_3111841 [Trichonephila clavipes]